MERESFENEQIAEFLNSHFVSIKVDREERPDLDQIYMSAIQIMTGHGGWPMSVFLTPDLHPFFGGTYWPPTTAMGRPGFDQVLTGVENAWRDRREQVLEQGAVLLQRIEASNETPASEHALNLELLSHFSTEFDSYFDREHGGIGRAPKFPHSVVFQVLFRLLNRAPSTPLLNQVVLTLDKMSQGGIFDHLAGGFARYSVDDRWFAPHFEKMLYDNALLTDLYLDGYLLTGQPRFATVARQTLDYILNDMTDDTGGFHSAEDADSEGVEGKFYLWSIDEIRDLLGDDLATVFCEIYNVSAQGNHEGKNILHLTRSLDEWARDKGVAVEELDRLLQDCRSQLLEVRAQRIRPAKDHKILVNWNALMIHSMARAGMIFQQQLYLDASSNAAQFILREMTTDDYRLSHSWCDGISRHTGFLDDYAFMVQAMLTLYDATCNEQWIDHAVEFSDMILTHFRDPEGGFFFSANDQQSLITRPKEIPDGAIPSGNAVAATAFLKLSKLTGLSRFSQAACEVLELSTGILETSPIAAGQMGLALDFLIGPTQEVVLVSGSESELPNRLHAYRASYRPHGLLAVRSGATGEYRSRYLDELFLGKHAEAESSTLFVCENQQCSQPITGPEAIDQAFQSLLRPVPS